MLRKSFIIIFCLVAFLLSCNEDDNPSTLPPSPEALPANFVTDWLDLQLYFVTRSPGFTPPVVSRAFAYCGLAYYEALVYGAASHQSLAGQLNGINENALPKPQAGVEYYFPIAANAAVAEMTRYMFENAPVPDLPKIDSTESANLALLRTTLPSEVVERSITFGKSISAALYTLSTTDGGHRGFNRNFPASYVPPVGTGLWVPTNSQLAMLPTWGNNRTFIKNLPTLIVPQGHPPFSTETTSSFYLEAMEVYNVTTNLTHEQEAIAFFWNDDPLITYTPPGHSLDILRNLLLRENKPLMEAAEAIVKMGIAQSDAFVLCWKIKYDDNLLRPVTYIQQHIDEFWNSLIITPPFPEYTSGHSTQSGCAAAILNDIFGGNYAFTDNTHIKLKTGLPARNFSSFDVMADECSNSRLYGGIHFRSANHHGKQTGYAVGAEVLKLQFTK